MELLKISADKLKLTLSREDMDAYRLDASEAGCGVGTRRAVRDILDEAKRRCGFDPEGGRLLVQMFPSAEGGCEIFVTRLGGEDGRAAFSLTAQAFVFEELDDLILCCAALDAERFLLENL